MGRKATFIGTDVTGSAAEKPNKPRQVPPPAPPQAHAAQAPQAPAQVAPPQAPAQSATQSAALSSMAVHPMSVPPVTAAPVGISPMVPPPVVLPSLAVPGVTVPGMATGAAPAIGPATNPAKAPPAAPVMAPPVVTAAPVTAPPVGAPVARAAAPVAAPSVIPSPGPSPAPSPAPAGGASRVRPPVRLALVKLRHRLILLSFLVFVMVPPVLAAIYLWGFAADQYNSKVGFSVRLEETNSPLGLLSGLTGISGSSSSDTDILFEFIQSQRLVADMDAELDLHAIWSRPQGDPVFALPPDAPLEELVDYWNDMVRLSRGKSAGLLEVEVRAFDPADAQNIATALFIRSTDMINQLSAIAREDAIRYAREDLDAAQERLKAARAAVTRFRNLNQIVNPEQDIQSQAGLLANLRNQQAAALIEIDLLRETANPGDPRLTQLERRLEVIETRIAAERDKFGLGTDGDDNTAYANLVGEYERLVADREFAERAYVTALASYDGALAESRRKSRYLAAYMQPTIAETPIYPRRLTLLTMLSLFLFLSWSIGVLIYYSVKDRR